MYSKNISEKKLNCSLYRNSTKFNEYTAKRERPYSNIIQSLSEILKKENTIPMNQRKYEWTYKEIKLLLDDIKDIINNTNNYFKMGSIIHYIDDLGIVYVYDGQQRIITVTLILKALSLCYKKIAPKVNDLLEMDDLLDDHELSENQRSIKNKFGSDIKIPKLYCVDPHDLEAIINVINYKVDKVDKQKYKKSKIYKAFECILQYIKDLKLSDGEKKLWYKYILCYIDIQVYTTRNYDYAVKIFEWENNRGVGVKKVSCAKNLILSNISCDKRQIVFDKWEKILNYKNNIYSKFGEKILGTALNLFNNKIDRKLDLSYAKKFLINSNHNQTYKNVIEMFKICQDLITIYEAIKDNRYGRLVNHKSCNKLNIEAYVFAFLPIFYIKKTVDDRLIKLFVNWYVRNISLGSKSFNRIAYSNKFINICNNLINDNNFDYHKSFKKVLNDEINPSIKTDNYIQTFINKPLKNSTARLIALYLETRETTAEYIPSFNCDAEHIHSKKNKMQLKDSKLINTIGNFTLYESKNTDDINFKGNRGVKNKNYNIKKTYYEKSSYKITRDIPKKYQKFQDDEIKIRGIDILKKLNKYTDYICKQ